MLRRPRGVVSLFLTIVDDWVQQLLQRGRRRWPAELCKPWECVVATRWLWRGRVREADSVAPHNYTSRQRDRGWTRETDAADRHGDLRQFIPRRKPLAGCWWYKSGRGRVLGTAMCSVLGGHSHGARPPRCEGCWPALSMACATTPQGVFVALQVACGGLWAMDGIGCSCVAIHTLPLAASTSHARHPGTAVH